METPPDGAAAEPAGAPVAGPSPSPDPLRDRVTGEREAVRQLIDAGASSPEELRELANRMREQRQREASLWAREVKPELVRARKGRFRLADLRPSNDELDRAQRRFLLAAGVVALVVLLLLSVVQVPVPVLLVPVAAFLGYAWRLGSGPPVEHDQDSEAPTA